MHLHELRSVDAVRAKGVVNCARGVKLWPIPYVGSDLDP
jgi:hypothetical protein